MSKPPPPAGLLLLLTVLFANGILAATMYLPSLPAISEALGEPVDVLPFTLTVYFATFAGAQLVYGPLSDRYGRRPLLLGQRAAIEDDRGLAFGQIAACGGNQRGAGAGAAGARDAGAAFPDPHANLRAVDHLGEFHVDALRE